MWLSSWLRNRTSERQPCSVSHRPTAGRFRPRLESLDDRCLPSTLTVLNTLDGPGATAGSFAPGSLRAEIAAAQAGDTIAFDPSLAGQTIALTLGQVAIAKNLTVQGPAGGHVTINGGVARVLEIDGTATAVTLSNLWIDQGQGNADANPSAAGTHPGDGYGGGVLNFGTLALTGCTLTGNRATYGGGVYNQGTLTVSGSTLSNDKATNDGGGICNGGGVYPGGTLTVNSSTLSADSAGYGGGIYSRGTASVTGSTLSHNGATYAGGGIYTAGTMTVGSSTLTGNSAGDTFGHAGNGGGIYNYSGSLTVSGCTLSSNSATLDGGGLWNNATLTVSGSTLSGNTATYKGGGIYNTGSGLLTITSSVVTDNVAPTGADLDNLGSAKISKDSTVGVIGR